MQPQAFILLHHINQSQLSYTEAGTILAQDDEQPIPALLSRNQSPSKFACLPRGKSYLFRSWMLPCLQCCPDPGGSGTLAQCQAQLGTDHAWRRSHEVSAMKRIMSGQRIGVAHTKFIKHAVLASTLRTMSFKNQSHGSFVKSTCFEHAYQFVNMCEKLQSKKAGKMHLHSKNTANTKKDRLFFSGRLLDIVVPRYCLASPCPNCKRVSICILHFFCQMIACARRRTLQTATCM